MIVCYIINNKRFFILYNVIGIILGITNVTMRPGTGLGASGSTSATIGLFLMLYFNNKTLFGKPARIFYSIFVFIFLADIGWEIANIFIEDKLMYGTPIHMLGFAFGLLSGLVINFWRKI